LKKKRRETHREVPKALEDSEKKEKKASRPASVNLKKKGL